MRTICKPNKDQTLMLASTTTLVRTYTDTVCIHTHRRHIWTLVLILQYTIRIQIQTFHNSLSKGFTDISICEGSFIYSQDQ